MLPRESFVKRLVCLVILSFAFGLAGQARGEDGASLLWACTIGSIDSSSP